MSVSVAIAAGLVVGAAGPLTGFDDSSGWRLVHVLAEQHADVLAVRGSVVRDVVIWPRSRSGLAVTWRRFRSKAIDVERSADLRASTVAFDVTVAASEVGTLREGDLDGRSLLADREVLRHLVSKVSWEPIQLPIQFRSHFRQSTLS